MPIHHRITVLTLLSSDDGIRAALAWYTVVPQQTCADALDRLALRVSPVHLASAVRFVLLDNCYTDGAFVAFGHRTVQKRSIDVDFPFHSPDTSAQGPRLSIAV